MSAATRPAAGRSARGHKGRPVSPPLPGLSSELHERVRRVFPTATRLILHSNTRLDRWRHVVAEEQFAAHDAQGRALWPLRPEELGDLCVQLRAHGGGGLLIIDLR